MNKEEIVKLLMKEDKSGLAYCMNQMKGKESNGYHFYYELLKRDLRVMVLFATDEQLMRLKDFQIYKHLF